MNLPSNVTVASGVAVSYRLVPSAYRLLGVTIDSWLSMDSHVNETVRSCNYTCRLCITVVRRSHVKVANTIQCSLGLISWHIEYCNSLLFGVSGQKIAACPELCGSTASFAAAATSLAVTVSETSHGIGPTSWPSSATKQTRTATVLRPILIVAVVRAVAKSIGLRSLSAAKLLHIPKHKTVAYLATVDRFYVAAPCRPIFGTSCLYLLEPSTTSPVLRLF